MNLNPFIIAEIGINHNGSIEIAKKLIDMAKRCNCDAVKFQKRDIDIVYSKDELKSLRESPWGNTFRQQKEGLEFNKKEYDEINSYCKKLNIIWFASAWDLNSLAFLDNYSLKFNKIASAMITNVEFLNEVSQRGKHTFISTGMSNLSDIQTAIDIFKKNKCSFEIMHTVSTYPCPEELLNLKMISFFKEKFKCNVGYSGHESSVTPSVVAATMGITSLERHITLDRSMYGSDQPASLEEPGLKNLVNSIRKIPVVLGEVVEKKIIKDEINIAKKLRYWEK